MDKDKLKNNLNHNYKNSYKGWSCSDKFQLAAIISQRIKGSGSQHFDMCVF